MQYNNYEHIIGNVLYDMDIFDSTLSGIVIGPQCVIGWK